MKAPECNWILMRWKNKEETEYLTRRCQSAGRPVELYWSDGKLPNYPLSMTKNEAFWSFYRAMEQEPDYNYKVSQVLR